MASSYAISEDIIMHFSNMYKIFPPRLRQRAEFTSLPDRNVQQRSNVMEISQKGPSNLAPFLVL